MTKRIVIGALMALLALAAVPSVASAARVSVRGNTIVYRAAPGEANRLTVNESDDFEFYDSGARGVRPGRGCRPAPGPAVECRSGRGRATIVIRLGDRADRIQTSFDDLDATDAARTVQHGGSGNDLLRGSHRSDRLLGGSGRDFLAGRGGSDAYAGGRGRDRIDAADFRRERVNCGSGRDRLLGNARDRAVRCERVRRAPTYLGRTAQGHRIRALRRTSRRAILRFGITDPEAPRNPGLVQLRVRVDRRGGFGFEVDTTQTFSFRGSPPEFVSGSGRFAAERVEGELNSIPFNAARVR